MRSTNEEVDQVTVVDVTDENSAVDANSESLRVLATSLTDYAIIRLDPLGVVNAWSAGAERLKGYKASEILGQNFSVFFTPEDRAADLPMKLLADARKSGTTNRTGWRVHKDGHLFWGDISLTALHDDQGELTGFVKVVRDLTERHEADELLRRSEEWFRLLMNNVTDYAIIGLDPQGVIQTWNAGAERIKGYSRDEIVGQHFSVFYTLEDQAAGLPMTMLAEAYKHGHAEYSGWRVRKNGSHFWGDVIVTALSDASGELVGYVKITRDLSERHAAEEAALRSAERDEMAMAEAKLHRLHLEFMQSISHDLRTPLTAIKGFASLLRSRDDLTPEQREGFVRQIEEGADRLVVMVEDLLEMAKLESGTVALKTEETPLRNAAEKVTDLLQSILGKRQVDIQVEASLRVCADPAALNRILTNLVGNAAKFSPDGMTITIAAHLADDEVVVSVSDQGMGVAEKDKEVIFQHFRQGSRVGDEHVKGSGIGLSMVRDYVQLHGGRVWVEDVADGGARFVFTLPQPPCKIHS